jgi:preprotein translocase subunit SecG
MQIAIGVVLIIAALFLIVAVLMQQGKSHNLSGVIAGGADTFFGKEKGSSINNKLSKLTTVVAIVFALLVLVSYFMQDTIDLSSYTAPITDASAVTEALGETVTDGAAAEEHDHAAEAVEGEVTEP